MDRLLQAIMSGRHESYRKALEVGFQPCLLTTMWRRANTAYVQKLSELARNTPPNPTSEVPRATRRGRKGSNPK